MTMVTSSLLRKLEGGDRRSIGRADEVVAAVLGQPTLFGSLFAACLGTIRSCGRGRRMPSRRLRSFIRNICSHINRT